MKSTSNSSISKHPIQLNWVGVKELSIKADRPGSRLFELQSGTFNIENSVSEFDEDDSTITVSSRIEIGSGELNNEMPIHVIVDLIAEFRVDISVFPVDKIPAWSHHIAPLIIYPYVRENVYALTSRAGFPSIILPLLEVPSLKKSELLLEETARTPE